MFSILSKTNFNFSAKCKLSSANAFNLNQCKNLSFGKELILRALGDNKTTVKNEICFGKGTKSFWKRQKMLVTSVSSVCTVHVFSKDFSIRTVKSQDCVV